VSFFGPSVRVVSVRRGGTAVVKTVSGTRDDALLLRKSIFSNRKENQLNRPTIPDKFIVVKLKSRSMIVRNAFKMRLKPGYSHEYQNRHENIWEDLKQLLKSNGIEDYSIFYDEETGTLFAVQKNQAEINSQDLGQHEIVRKWWAYMSDIMECNPDNSPVTVPLKEVFHLD
jgi:L-rhamnose mutarotase